MKEIIDNKLSKCCSGSVRYNQVMMEEYGGEHYICNKCKDNCDVYENKFKQGDLVKVIDSGMIGKIEYVNTDSYYPYSILDRMTNTGRNFKESEIQLVNDEKQMSKEKLLMLYTKSRKEIDDILYRKACTSFEDVPKRLINKVDKLGSEILSRMK